MENEKRENQFNYYTGFQGYEVPTDNKGPISPKREAVKRKSSNREIIILTYFFVSLVILVLVNMTYYLTFKSEETIDNPYNKRQYLTADQMIRGKIIANNGEILAETLQDSKGNERRYYPFRNLFCHVVGNNYQKSKSGIELSENYNLLHSGQNQLATLYNQLSDVKTPGNNIVTTLDVDLQKVAYDALGKHKGSVVVMEPDSGKILAMVSKPDYDPNKLMEKWDGLVESSLLNRATQGLYPPGSTFKILTALEYIKENRNFEKYSYKCKGKDIFSGVKIKCFGSETHGRVNLEESFAESCNTSFANIGTGLNLKSFRGLCDNFLFNKELPINIAYKKSSFVLNGNSDPSEVPQTVLGQGKTLISPFHNALIVSAIANNGVLMNPYLVDSIQCSNGSIVKKNMPSVYGTLISTEEAKTITKYMEAVVEYGTASKLNKLKVRVAGKTGTAEFNKNKDSHAWFVGFAPSENPQLVVSIIVEGAGTGSSYAVPIAKKLIQKYMEKEK